MTTIIMTDTIMAADHFVVTMGSTTTYDLDTTYTKIIQDPEKRFVFGLSGDMDPDDVRGEVMIGILGKFIHVVEHGLGSNTTTQIKVSHDDKYGIFLSRLVGREDLNGTRMLIATKKSKLGLKVIERSEDGERFLKLMVVRHNVFSSIGSGANFARGLYIGGFDIPQIFEKVSELDEVTSKEHTIIDLSDLVEWDESVCV